MCALRDFAPGVVAVEHLLQPVAKDRTQLLTSRLGTCTNVARSPSLTTHRQRHIGDPVDRCPNRMPATQVSANAFPGSSNVFQQVRDIVRISTVPSQRSCCHDIPFPRLTRRRGDPTSRALQVNMPPKVPTSFADSTSKPPKELRLESYQRDSLVPGAHVVHEASFSPTLEDAPRTLQQPRPTNSHGRH